MREFTVEKEELLLEEVQQLLVGKAVVIAYGCRESGGADYAISYAKSKSNLIFADKEIAQIEGIPVGDICCELVRPCFTSNGFQGMVPEVSYSCSTQFAANQISGAVEASELTSLVQVYVCETEEGKSNIFPLLTKIFTNCVSEGKQVA